MTVGVKAKWLIKFISFCVLFSGYLICLYGTLSRRIWYESLEHFGAGMIQIIYLFGGIVLLAFLGFVFRKKNLLFWGTIGVFSIGLMLILNQSYQYNGEIFSEDTALKRMRESANDHHKEKLFKIDSLSTEIVNNPENAHAYLEQARLHEGNHAQKGEMIFYYRQSIRLDPGNVEAYLELARVYRRSSRQKDSTIYYYKEAIELDPKNAQTYLELGEVYRHSPSESDNTIHYFKQAILYSDGRKLIDVKRKLARFYMDRKMLEESKLLYREILRQDSTNKMVINQLKRVEKLIADSTE